MGLWKASGRKGLGGRQGALALLLGAVLLLCGCGTGASDGSAASGGGASGGSQAMSEEELAQHAYDLLEAAETICGQGMQSYRSVWQYGIEIGVEQESAVLLGESGPDADTVLDGLASRMGVERSFLEENGGYTAEDFLHGDGTYDGWQFCLWATENCYAAIGYYEGLDSAMETAQDIIKSLPEGYEHRQALKDYYTKVAAYAAYFEDVTGSYNSSGDSVAAYESAIETAKEGLLFDFG